MSVHHDNWMNGNSERTYAMMVARATFMATGNVTARSRVLSGYTLTGKKARIRGMKMQSCSRVQKLRQWLDQSQVL